MSRPPLRALAAILASMLMAAPASAVETVPAGLPTTLQEQLNQPITANFEEVDFVSAI